MKTIVTHDVSETEDIGRQLGEKIISSDKKHFIAMYGDLGAGKTAFVRGLASCLSPGSRVKSPTYTIVNEYRKGLVPLFHFDLYRIGDTSELDGFGFDEYLAGGNCIAEWSENLGDMLPDGAVKVTIEKLDDVSRKITIENFDL
ncbi:MAG: tRNA (adenosine(37)-N6)-threonylcarbamoyltransferase complex ATPase subunit type 1 TsaE [Ruminococcaceae bacterium]|nr:tRNA (adenosine(37)-N6)-threonylcarbamoyltransferase complex ATPase subunit type 1 TsaE [Oscillospiraceae bacterium]